MNLHGVDVYIWQNTVPDVPKSHGGMDLKFVSSRGTRLHAPPEPGTTDWFQCRFLSQGEVGDQDVDNLVRELTGLGFRWTKTQKLFKQDDVNLFSEPY